MSFPEHAGLWILVIIGAYVVVRHILWPAAYLILYCYGYSLFIFMCHDDGELFRHPLRSLFGIVFKWPFKALKNVARYGEADEYSHDPTGITWKPLFKYGRKPLRRHKSMVIEEPQP